MRNGGGADAPSNEVLLMVQFGAGFFLFGFALAKVYKAAKKALGCGDGDDIDPETGKSCLQWWLLTGGNFRRQPKCEICRYQ